MFYYAYVSYSSALWIPQYLVQEGSLHFSLPLIESIGWAFQTGILTDFGLKS